VTTLNILKKLPVSIALILFATILIILAVIVQNTFWIVTATIVGMLSLVFTVILAVEEQFMLNVENVVEKLKADYKETNDTEPKRGRHRY
jgi:hypothetical protein